jgi:hypothetical protein
VNLACARASLRWDFANAEGEREYFDIGGFGASSDLTLQAFAGIGYRFTDWFSMVLGYRYLYYDFGDTKFVKDLNLYGGSLGLNFSF